mmetsp:Transcript_37598/g.103786  ORF Transcript_37598/g.103786 Transcript_37598/m.103786 type:complete len:221 (-) Transcript_37598:263-925(-)
MRPIARMRVAVLPIATTPSGPTEPRAALKLIPSLSTACRPQPSPSSQTSGTVSEWPSPQLMVPSHPRSRAARFSYSPRTVSICILRPAPSPLVTWAQAVAPIGPSRALLGATPWRRERAVGSCRAVAAAACEVVVRAMPRSRRRSPLCRSPTLASVRPLLTPFPWRGPVTWSTWQARRPAALQRSLSAPHHRSTASRTQPRTLTRRPSRSATCISSTSPA